MTVTLAEPSSPFRERALDGRSIALGVTGSISAYKAADLASKLRQAGASVEVLMTEAATRFIAPLTFQSLTGQEAIVDMFETEEAEAHVEVARRADAFVIAPATADCLARLAYGGGGDMVTLTALATTAPIVVAPAMDSQMWSNAAVAANVEALVERGVEVVGPEEGRLASGRHGAGRLAETAAIVGAVRAAIGRREGDLCGRSVIVTAGGTQEPLDPVRYIGNRSSGRMGFSLAKAARDRGARVSLVTGPSPLNTPYGVNRINVKTVEQMLEALEPLTETCDALLMAAAPADFRPLETAGQKIKKASLSEDEMRLELTETPDIISTLPGGGVRVAFAAETENLKENATAKLASKRAAFIVANDVTAAGSGFGTETNEVTIFHGDGEAERLPLLSKYAVAHAILDRVAALL
ncbi:MAG: bifunctional phosphopantothenoylcysteine decarboxylase/phosphopantothenate--cysteine ligase CoaBC [Chloroflexi bacterium]|nr:bifunctional phosphopantothenoylcysteine decarboxylase/phosphopantothenate--cysteine ligase CoaBC [Chloroflexota bacterium]